VNLKLNKQGDTAVVSVEGRVDTVTAPEFEQKMLEWIDSGENLLVLDLSEMEYISSAGLRAFLISAKRAKANGGGLACCCLQDMVRRVFEVSGFSLVIPVYPSADEARDAL
jgi:anti-anti-sigma factor